MSYIFCVICLHLQAFPGVASSYSFIPKSKEFVDTSDSESDKQVENDCVVLSELFIFYSSHVDSKICWTEIGICAGILILSNSKLLSISDIVPLTLLVGHQEERSASKN